MVMVAQTGNSVRRLSYRPARCPSLSNRPSQATPQAPSILYAFRLSVWTILSLRCAGRI